MKTNIAGWLNITLAPIFIIAFFVSYITAQNPYLGPKPSFIYMPLIIALLLFVMGSGLRGHKRWAAFLTFIIGPIMLFFEIRSLTYTFSWQMLIIMLITIYTLLAVVSEKKLFVK